MIPVVPIITGIASASTLYYYYYYYYYYHHHHQQQQQHLIVLSLRLSDASMGLVQSTAWLSYTDSHEYSNSLLLLTTCPSHCRPPYLGDTPLRLWSVVSLFLQQIKFLISSIGELTANDTDLGARSWPWQLCFDVKSNLFTPLLQLKIQ